MRAMASADGAGPVSAAVRAAILAKAPHRAVSAVAAVVSAVGTHAEAACQTQLSAMPQVVLRPWRSRGRRELDRGRGRKNDGEPPRQLPALVSMRRERRCRQRRTRDEDRASLLPVLTWRKRSTESTQEESEERFRYDGSGPFCGAANID